MFTSVTAAAQQVPAYCTSGHGVITPAQWKTCWNAGWSQPTGGAASFGHAVGGNVGPVLIVAAIVLLLVAVARRRSGSPATN